MKKSDFVRFVAAAVLACSGCAGTAYAQQSTLVVSPNALSFSSTSGEIPVPQNLSIVSSGGALQFTAQSSVAPGVTNWLSVSPQSGTTPGSVMVFVTPGVVPAGTHVGTITITAANATNSPVTVPVTLTVNPTSQLTASPAQLTFEYVINGTLPAAQTINVGTTTGIGLAFSASASVSGGTNWLSVNPQSAAAPNASLTVSVNPVGLAAATYNGTITLTPGGGAGGALQVPVTLKVNATPQLTISQSALSFYYQIGGSSPPPQTLSVTTPGATVSFSAIGRTGTGGDWLVVFPLSGATPSDLAVSISPAVLATLPQNTYNGTVTITAPGASESPKTIPVTLTVSPNPLLSASPSSLSFDVQPGGSAPATKTIAISSTGTPIAFNVTTTTTTPGINWLSVTPGSGATPATLTVGIAPSGLALAPGTYTGTVVITAPNAANTILNVPVTLNVSNVPALSLSTAALSFNYQTGKALPTPQTVDLSSSGAPINFTAAASSTGNWLAISQNSGTTPATLIVAVNPAGLAPNTYQGTITITPAVSGASVLNLNVSLTVSNNPLLNASPNALTYRFDPGGAGFNQKTLAVSSTSDPLNFTVTTREDSGPSGWLFASPLSGVTSSNLTVTVISSALQPGVYRGAVTVAATGANTQTIPVTVTVTTGNTLSVTPESLSFTQAQGAAAPPAKTLEVSTSGASLTFSATATTAVGSWLSVTPANGTTPGTLSVSVNGSGLAQGTYQGSITVVASGAANSPRTIPVTLTVGPAQTISVSPASLTFTHQVGASAPAAQKIAVSSTGGALSFSASATSTGGNWLSVSPTTGTSPRDVNVTVNPAGLAPGSYTGTVRIESAAASNSPQTVNVTLNVAAMVVGPVTAVVNAASYAPGPVAPGEIVTLGGTNIGPATEAGLRVTQGLVDTRLAETRVLFDGIPAPLIYVSRNQINCVVPYGVAGRMSTRVQVEYQGVRSEALELRVAETVPGIFSLDASGRGQGAILNQNYSVNGPNNPADKGSVVMIYATGEGQTNPPGLDGLVITEIAQLRSPVKQDLTVTIGGRPARWQYAGSAPNFVSGVLQLNVVVPEDAPSGSAVPVVVTIGGNSSPSTITMAIR